MLNKNICFVNSYKFWGGGEKSYYQYAKKLAERGYKIHFIINEESELFFRLNREEWAEIYTLKTNSSIQFNPSVFIKMFNYIKKNKIDIMFVNSHKDWKAVGVPSKLLKVKKIIFTRGVSDRIGVSTTKKFYFDNVITDILVKSEDSKSLLSKSDERLVKGKIRVLKNGLDLENFDFTKKNKLYLSKAGEVVLGVSCRLEAVKRVTDLIDMVKILKTKYNKNVKLLIAGTGSQKENLIEKIEKLNLKNDVQLLGFQSNIEEFLNSLDIFLFPSEMEGLSNSMLEAMAFSLPIVSYRITSMPELIEDGENGFLVNPFDIELYAEKVLKLIEDPQLREEFGKNSRLRIEKEFSMEKVMDRYEQLINN